MGDHDPKLLSCVIMIVGLFQLDHKPCFSCDCTGCDWKKNLQMFLAHDVTDDSSANGNNWT